MIEIYIFKVESFSETKVWCVAWEHEMDIDQEKKQEREVCGSWERLRLEGMTKEQCGMCGRWQSETKTTSASDDSDERERCLCQCFPLSQSIMSALGLMMQCANLKWKGLRLNTTSKKHTGFEW